MSLIVIYLLIAIAIEAYNVYVTNAQISIIIRSIHIN